MIDTNGVSLRGRIAWAVFYHCIIGVYVSDIDALFV